MPLAARRAAELLGLMIIGDSIATVADPKRHLGLWAEGPQPWRRMMRPFLRHPQVSRALGAAGLVAGLWLIGQQTPQG